MMGLCALHAWQVLASQHLLLPSETQVVEKRLQACLHWRIPPPVKPAECSL